MPVAPEHAGGGPFYFALSSADEPVFGSEYLRYDEYVLSFQLNQKEGDYATLSCDIKNPNAGLYAPGTNIYVWFSKDSGSDVEPIFRGRMVGLPSDLLGEVVTIQFTARPIDVAAQKSALADTLKVLPNYDEVFVSQEQRDNPDNILEGYSALWHFDRVTHEVTISDILVGEDGALDFEDGLYDNVKVTLESSPLSSVSFDGSVTWQQQVTGTVNLGQKKFTSYSAAGIAASWPKAGQSIGSGWSVANSAVLTDMSDKTMITVESHYVNGQKKHNDGDTMSVDESYSGPAGYDGTLSGLTMTYSYNITIGDPESGTPASSYLNRTAAVLGGETTAVMTLELKYDANRKREEHVKFTLTADLQPVLQPEDSSNTNDPIVVSGVDVGLPLSDSSIPIGSVENPSYFATERGLQSLQHLLCRARARLLLGARVGRVSWDVPFDDATALTLRKNAFLADARVSGGALGKIVEYSIQGNGDSGDFIGNVTIAGAVGNATAIEVVEGDADYIEDDYIEPAMYIHTGTIVVLSSGDIGFTPPIFEYGDDFVFPLTADQVVISETITNTIEEQDAAIAANPVLPVTYYLNPSNIISLNSLTHLNQVKLDAMRKEIEATAQEYELVLKSVTGGPFTTEYDIVTTILSIPKQIDLAAVP